MSLSWRTRLLGTKELGQVSGGSATQDYLCSSFISLTLPFQPPLGGKSYSQREAPGLSLIRERRLSAHRAPLRLVLVYTETEDSNDPDPPAAELTVLW